MCKPKCVVTLVERVALRANLQLFNDTLAQIIEVFREVCEASHSVVTSPMFMRTTSIVFVVLCQAGLLRNSRQRKCFLVDCDGTEPPAQIFCESFSCLQLQCN